MRKHKLSRDTIECLDILLKEKEALSLKEIALKFELKINPRALERILRELCDSHRVFKEGQASATKYRIDKIQAHYKRYKFLYIYKSDIATGILFKLDDSYVFYYLNEYLVDISLQAIATMQLQVLPHHLDGVPPVFEENIPEGINKEILEVNSKSADEFDILPILKDNIGDISFSRTLDLASGNKEDKSPSYLKELDKILNCSEFENNKINILDGYNIDLSDVEIFPEGHDLTKLKELQSKNDGISGFQYKVLANIDFEEKRVYTQGSDSSFILKPYSKIKANKELDEYFPHIALNEHLHMNFAKNELGFNVPFSAIFKRDIDEEYHYIVKRFDRYKNHKFAKATFATFLGLVSETKYNTTTEKMVKRISLELISETEKMEFLKHYIYSIFIVHEDMHTKNLSLIFSKNTTSFSPLYDIASTGIYATSKGYESHLTVNGKQTNIRPNDFKDICKILKVSHKEFKKEAAKIAEIYSERFEDYILEVKKLDCTVMYEKQLKKKVGDDTKWICKGKPKRFGEVLESYHKNRIQSLKKLGWF